MKVRIISISYAINIVLLFLIGVNFMGIGIHLSIILLIKLLVNNGISTKIKKDNLGVILFVFLLSYSYFMNLYGSDTSVYYFYCIAPCICYYVGKNIVTESWNGRITSFIIAPILGLSIWGVLNMYQTTITPDSYFTISRQSVDFWNKQLIVSSKQAGYFSMLSSFLGIKLWISRFKLLDIIMCIFLAVGIFSTGTRSLLLTFSVLALLGYIYFIRTGAISKKNKHTKLQKLFLVLLVFLIIYSLDLFGIATRINSSTLFLRLTGMSEHDNVAGLFDDNGRNLRYALFFSQVLSHPFGNINLGDYGSAHNTYFDVYRVGGIIPFTLFILLVITIIRKIVKANKVARSSYGSDVVYITFIVMGMFLIFLVESMIALNIYVMSIFFYIIGMSSKIAECSETNYKEMNSGESNT